VYSGRWQWLGGGGAPTQATHGTHSSVAPSSSAAFWTEIIVKSSSHIKVHHIFILDSLEI
jgi:hypothetical protein